MIFPERFRHHRQREQAEHILFVRFAQLNAHSERRDGSDRRAFIYDAELGDAFGHEFMEGERNVAGLHRCAIVKTCPRVQRDFRPGEVIGVTHVLGNQRIVAAGLVIGGDKERIVKRFRSRGRHAAQGVAVEVVEGSRGGKRDLTAFWRGWVDVIEVRKIDRVFRLANHREGDILFDGLRLAGQARECQHQQHKAHKHLAAAPSLQTGSVKLNNK